MIGIYKIQNLVNGKVYIGQSIHIEQRWKQHRLIQKNCQNKPLYKAFVKYGLDNFSFQVIEECEIEKLNEREQYWIDYYNSYIGDENSNGYNLTRGGEGYKTLSKEQIQQMIQLWNDGLSTSQIGAALSHDKTLIRAYLKNQCNNYTIDEGRERGKNARQSGKKINQYSLDGTFIKQYPNGKIAAKENDIDYSNLKRAVKGQFIQTHGYIFIYADEDQQKQLQKRFLLQQQLKEKDKHCHSVEQYNLETGMTIAVFCSYAEAARKLFYPAARRYISECCSGKREQYQGYGWRNKND